MSKRGNKASNKRKTPVKTPQPKLATPTKKAVKQEPVKQEPVKQEPVKHEPVKQESFQKCMCTPLYELPCKSGREL